MITTGLFSGGPEQFGWGVGRAWGCLERAIERFAGEPKQWRERVSGVNVIFFVPGSVMAHESVTVLKAVRFSRKSKLLIVNAPISQDVARDYDRSLSLMISAVGKSIDLADDAFARKGAEPFDAEAARHILARAIDDVINADGCGGRASELRSEGEGPTREHRSPTLDL